MCVHTYAGEHLKVYEKLKKKKREAVPKYRHLVLLFFSPYFFKIEV